MKEGLMLLIKLGVIMYLEIIMLILGNQVITILKVKGVILMIEIKILKILLIFILKLILIKIKLKI
jgi:hypothetical protein